MSRQQASLHYLLSDLKLAKVDLHTEQRELMSTVLDMSYALSVSDEFVMMLEQSLAGLGALTSTLTSEAIAERKEKGGLEEQVNQIKHYLATSCKVKMCLRSSCRFKTPRHRRTAPFKPFKINFSLF